MSITNNDRPNIVLVLADSMRARNVSCYGYDYQTTPNIDRLAASGIRFANTFVQAPFTIASTASILTGVYPSVHELERYGQRLVDDLVVLPELLKQAGYYTAAFVANPHINHKSGLTRGFDHFTDGRPWFKRPRFMGPFVAWAESGRALNREVSKQLNRLKPNRQPFFFFVFYNDSHVPFSSLPKMLLPLVGRKFHTPDFETTGYTDGEMARIQQLYDRALHRADHRIGQLYKILKRHTCMKNTTVIISADHGEGLDRRPERAGHGRLYENGIHVPLIALGPDIPGGRVIREFITSLDYAPTLCELAETDPHEQFQGYSFAPTLQGYPREQQHNYVISQYHDCCCVRTERWKLIRRDIGISGPIADPISSFELYDLANDPFEESNIAGKNLDIMSDLSRILDDQTLGSIEYDHTPEQFELDASVVDRLRGLGYID